MTQRTLLWRRMRMLRIIGRRTLMLVPHRVLVLLVIVLLRLRMLLGALRLIKAVSSLTVFIFLAALYGTAF